MDDLLATARRRFDAGDAVAALAPAQRALAEAEPGSAQAANIHVALSAIHERLSQYDEAEHHARQAVALTDMPPHGRLRVHALASLAVMARIRDRLDEAEGLYLSALALAEEDTASLLCGLGIVHKCAGRYDDAERVYREALALIGPDEPEAAAVWHNLGGIEHSRGRHAEGELHARRSVALRERALGPDHPIVAADRAALASLLVGQRRFDEAKDLYRQALLVFQRVYPADHHSVTVTARNLAALER
ncbi:tetratricopeptide repeat protein [Kutzneria sp. NPDC051319]|uniref:tetratricopeptide repeat protein n=1 Tax=Kutzneria sp. NPDC051319 TaxID=3155047 RepID=UPI00343C845F